MLKAVVNSPVRSGNQTINDGDLVIGTAGKGVDFSANTHAAGMTSEKLNWYEEGTFTATFTCTVSNPTTPVTTTAFYTRVGRLVTAVIPFPIPFDTTGASGNIRVTGLPFTLAARAVGTVLLGELGTAPAVGYMSTSVSGAVQLLQAADIYTPIPVVTTVSASLHITITYMVS